MFTRKLLEQKGFGKVLDQIKALFIAADAEGNANGKMDVRCGVLPTDRTEPSSKTEQSQHCASEDHRRSVKTKERKLRMG